MAGQKQSPLQVLVYVIVNVKDQDWAPVRIPLNISLITRASQDKEGLILKQFIDNAISSKQQGIRIGKATHYEYKDSVFGEYQAVDPQSLSILLQEEFSGEDAQGEIDMEIYNTNTKKGTFRIKEIPIQFTQQTALSSPKATKKQKKKESTLIVYDEYFDITQKLSKKNGNYYYVFNAHYAKVMLDCWLIVRDLSTNTQGGNEKHWVMAIKTNIRSNETHIQTLFDRMQYLVQRIWNVCSATEELNDLKHIRLSNKQNVEKQENPETFNFKGLIKNLLFQLAKYANNYNNRVRGIVRNKTELKKRTKDDSTKDGEFIVKSSQEVNEQSQRLQSEQNNDERAQRKVKDQYDNLLMDCLLNKQQFDRVTYQGRTISRQKADKQGVIVPQSFTQLEIHPLVAKWSRSVWGKEDWGYLKGEDDAETTTNINFNENRKQDAVKNNIKVEKDNSDLKEESATVTQQQEESSEKYDKYKGKLKENKSSKVNAKLTTQNSKSKGSVPKNKVESSQNSSSDSKEKGSQGSQDEESLDSQNDDPKNDKNYEPQAKRLPHKQAVQQKQYKRQDNQDSEDEQTQKQSPKKAQQKQQKSQTKDQQRDKPKKHQNLSTVQTPQQETDSQDSDSEDDQDTQQPPQKAIKQKTQQQPKQLPTEKAKLQYYKSIGQKVQKQADVQDSESEDEQPPKQPPKKVAQQKTQKHQSKDLSRDQTKDRQHKSTVISAQKADDSQDLDSDENQHTQQPPKQVVQKKIQKQSKEPTRETTKNQQNKGIAQKPQQKADSYNTDSEDEQDLKQAPQKNVQQKSQKHQSKELSRDRPNKQQNRSTNQSAQKDANNQDLNSDSDQDTQQPPKKPIHKKTQKQPKEQTKDKPNIQSNKSIGQNDQKEADSQSSSPDEDAPKKQAYKKAQQKPQKKSQETRMDKAKIQQNKSTVQKSQKDASSQGSDSDDEMHTKQPPQKVVQQKTQKLPKEKPKEKAIIQQNKGTPYTVQKKSENQDLDSDDDQPIVNQLKKSNKSQDPNSKPSMKSAAELVGNMVQEQQYTNKQTSSEKRKLEQQTEDEVKQQPPKKPKNRIQSKYIEDQHNESFKQDKSHKKHIEKDMDMNSLEDEGQTKEHKVPDTFPQTRTQQQVQKNQNIQASTQEKLQPDSKISKDQNKDKSIQNGNAKDNSAEEPQKDKSQSQQTNIQSASRESPQQHPQSTQKQDNQNHNASTSEGAVDDQDQNVSQK